MTVQNPSKPIPRSISWARYLVLSWLVLTVLFWSLSPSATEGYAAGLRLIFWALHVGIPLILLQTAQLGLQSMALVRHQPAVGQVLLAGTAGAILFVPIALLLDGVFPDNDLDAPMSLARQAVSELISLVLPVSLAWLGLNAPRLIRIASVENPAAPAQRFEQPDLVDALWEKLPEAAGRDIVSMSAELHYLRVATALDDVLVLFPFGVAIGFLDDQLGMRIHRSHWVAFAHIEAVEKSGDRWTCRMKNGQGLPVSRKYRSQMKERGITGA